MSLFEKGKTDEKNEALPVEGQAAEKKTGTSKKSRSSKRSKNSMKSKNAKKVEESLEIKEQTAEETAETIAETESAAEPAAEVAAEAGQEATTEVDIAEEADQEPVAEAMTEETAELESAAEPLPEVDIAEEAGQEAATEAMTEEAAETIAETESAAEADQEPVLPDMATEDLEFVSEYEGGMDPEVLAGYGVSAEAESAPEFEVSTDAEVASEYEHLTETEPVSEYEPEVETEPVPECETADQPEAEWNADTMEGAESAAESDDASDEAEKKKEKIPVRERLLGIVNALKSLPARLTAPPTEEEEEALREEFEQNGGQGQSRLFSIRNKIVIGFMVPIIFMIVIGMTAYRKASVGMSESFQLSTKQTIATAMEYVDITCSFVEAEAKKYMKDNDVVTYVRDLYSKDDQMTLVNKMKGITNDMSTSKSDNDFIKNIHILTKPGVKVLSTAKFGYPGDGLIEDYAKELGDEKKNLSAWTDHHDYLDGELQMNQQDYILVYQVYCQARAGIVVVDVDASAVQKFISKIDLGEGSVVGFVTMNGREIINENLAENGKSILTEGEKVFFGQEFYEELGEENMEGAQPVKYKGKNYLFIYSRSQSNGCTICALVPMTLVTRSAEGIKLVTIGLVILAVIIVVIVCFIVASGIQNNMLRIATKLGEVAEGDLTVVVTAKGRDEFRGLAGSANNMIQNTKKLVNKVSDATDQLEASSVEVEETSGVLNDYSRDITLAINDINEGMARQSVHAQECVNRTDILSNQIQDVSRVVEKVEKLVSNTQEMINQGMEIAHILGNRAEETTKITAKVGDSIHSLRRESEIINTFVETISEISEQTNLLSLNASIEAARAGEVGRGFAVVAQEIRKLADSSAQAAREISNNVSHISAQTMNSVESANQAQSMVELQTKAVEDTIELFRQMQERMVQLVDGLQEIVVCTEKADSERSEAVAAVRNISDIIGETASSAETVNDVAEKLMQNVENLNRTAGMLGENMEGLKAEIAVFKR